VFSPNNHDLAISPSLDWPADFGLFGPAFRIFASAPCVLPLASTFPAFGRGKAFGISEGMAISSMRRNEVDASDRRWGDHVGFCIDQLIDLFVLVMLATGKTRINLCIPTSRIASLFLKHACIIYAILISST
jgi:hypothetical protein